jgi:farnesyl-diphosphate farnesyltransferase
MDASGESGSFLAKLGNTALQVLKDRMQKDPVVVSAAVGAVVLASIYNDYIPLPRFLEKKKGILGYLFNPKDLFAMFVFKFTQKMPQVPQGLNDNDNWCYKKLIQTSRSFSAPILALDAELQGPVCVFYIVLRGLDSIEDDMVPPVGDKVKHLQEFYQRLEQPGWNLKGYGEKPHEIDLLENFDKVIDMYSRLKPAYRKVISDITKEMGFGMAKYLEAQVVTLEDWNEYCHYVAGVVGEGLSRLFAESGLEDPKYATLMELSNDMGLFLQKTNIIRDYLEDVSQKPPRVFYPKVVWSKYAEKIEDFAKPQNIKSAVTCLNELITNAMNHAIPALDYMKGLRDPHVFRFCAIPQVMAIATLELCYNNPNVFKWEVKIRKGEAVRMILNTNNYKEVCGVFLSRAKRWESNLPKNDPHVKELRALLKQVQERCLQDMSA